MNNMKKLLSFAVTLCLLMAMLPAMALAEDAPSNGVTIYFVNTRNWSAAYIWAEDNWTLGSWPGTPMNPIGTDAEGRTVYSISLDSTPPTFRFCSEYGTPPPYGEETVLLDFPTDGNNCFIPDRYGSIDLQAVGKWSVYNPSGVNYISKVINPIAVQEGKKTALPKYKGAKVTWTLKEGDTVATLKGDKVTGAKAGTETTLTMHVDSLTGKGLTVDGHAVKENTDYPIHLVVLAKGELVKKVSFVDEQGKKLKKLAFSLSSDVQIAQLKPVFNPTDAKATKLFYFSTDPKVATVNEDGVVTAVGKGKAKIFVYTTSLKKATVNVTVNE